MWDTARVEHVRFDAGRRILVMSDLHAVPSFFDGLLRAVDFGREDILVLVGDLMEKGADSLGLLHRVMEVAQSHTVYTVCGNCDELVYRFVDTQGKDAGWEDFYRRYLPQHPESAIWQLARWAGCPEDRLNVDGFAHMRRAMRENCGQELDFLRRMPHILETEHYVFVHGGVPSMEHMEGLSAFHVMKNDDFLSQGYSFDKYCIVGHWPVTLYDPAIPNASPLLCRDRRIISLDGGCALKADGQLNALVIPEDGAQSFFWAAYDGLERVRALDSQRASAHPLNIRWGHSRVQVLKRGEELSRCRHTESGREMDILNRYLYQWQGETFCRDSTDYELPVEPGDMLALVAQTKQGILAKKDGATGWYRGRFTSERNKDGYVGISPLDPRGSG